MCPAAYPIRRTGPVKIRRTPSVTKGLPLRNQREGGRLEESRRAEVQKEVGKPRSTKEPESRRVRSEKV